MTILGSPVHDDDDECDSMHSEPTEPGKSCPGCGEGVVQCHGRGNVVWSPKWSEPLEDGWYLVNIHGGCEADDPIAIKFCPWCGISLAMTGCSPIAARVQQYARDILNGRIQDRELFARAWLEATGLKPEESVMCEQDSYPDGSTMVRRVWFEKKGEVLP